MSAALAAPNAAWLINALLEAVSPAAVIVTPVLRAVAVVVIGSTCSVMLPGPVPDAAPTTCSHGAVVGMATLHAQSAEDGVTVREKVPPVWGALKEDWDSFVEHPPTPKAALRLRRGLVRPLRASVTWQGMWKTGGGRQQHHDSISVRSLYSAHGHQANDKRHV